MQILESVTADFVTFSMFFLYPTKPDQNLHQRRSLLMENKFLIEYH
jgi:hypothetical protein